MDERREQVVKQLKAVAHLATALAEVSGQLAKGYADPTAASFDGIVEMTGERTAHQMEVLGDMLNGMDAVTDEDEWLTPIFDAAHKMWPQE
jgi:hypothetical protein